MLPSRRANGTQTLLAPQRKRLHLTGSWMPRNPAAAIACQSLLSVPDPASFSLSLKAGQPQELEPLGQTNTCQYKRLREMEQEGPDFPIYVIFFLLLLKHRLF